MNARVFVAVALACNCLCGRIAGAQSQGTSLPLVPFAGVVQSSKGVPLRGVHIELKRLSDGMTTATQTNSAGLFRYVLAEGQYQLTATSRTQTISKAIHVALGTNWTGLTLNGDQRAALPPVISAVRLAVPKQARKIYMKVRDELIKRDHAAAARHLEKAVELYPEFVEALSTRSVLERDTNPGRALADAKRAIELDPNYGEGYVALASAYTSVGKFDDAVRMLDRGIALAPTFWLGYYEMSRVLLCKQDYAAAMGYLEIASPLVPNRIPFLHITRADAFSGLHDNSAAIHELEAYLREAPRGEQISEARQKLARLKSR